MRVMNSKGMSLKELLIVNTVIVGMAVASIPLFYRLQNMSRENSFIEIAKMLDSSLSSLKVKQVLIESQQILPKTLDQNPTSAVCTSCFENVIDKGVESKLWFKLDATTYLYSTNGNLDTNQDAYNEKGDYTLTYNPETLTINTTKN